MKVRILQSNLRAALERVRPAVPKRVTLPATSCVALASHGKGLQLTTTNLEVAILTVIGAQFDSLDSPGALVDFGTLRDLVRNAPDDEVVLDTGAKTFSCGAVTAELQFRDRDEFPPVPQVDGGAAIMVDAGIFADRVARVIPNVATDDSRPVLTGMKLTFTGQDLEFAAADGFRLGIDRMTVVESEAGPFDVIVPGAALKAVLSAAKAHDGEDLVLHVDALRPENPQFPERKVIGFARFVTNNVNVTTRLIQGTFPNYPTIVPKALDADARLDVDVSEMLAGVKSLAGTAKANGIVRIWGQRDGLRMTAKADETAEVTVKLAGAHILEPGSVAIDYKLLMEQLAALPSDRALMRWASPQSPVVFTTPARPDFKGVVMPTFVQWGETKAAQEAEEGEAPEQEVRQ